MRPTENIEKFIRETNAKTNAETDVTILRDLLNALDESKKSAKFKPNLWRIIMKGKLAKLAVAAAVILIVLVGIPFFNGTGPKVTLAGVYQKMQLVNAFRYKIKMNVTGNMQPGMPTGEQKIEGTITFAEYGAKMDMDMSTEANGTSQKMTEQVYVLPQEKKIYMIMNEQKQYISMEFTDDLFANYKQQSNDPRDMVKKILNCKYTELGKSTIDDIEVQGFQTTDAAAYSGNQMEDLKVVLWVDVRTWLPVRMEMNMKMTEQMKMDGVTEDFQWDLKVDKSEFEPVIPQDYTTPLPGGIKFPSFSEESAIEGLKFCSELLGKYPKKLDTMILVNEIVAIKDSSNPTEAALKLQAEIGKLSDEGKEEKILELMKPVMSLGMFNMTLVQDKKEPAYYGDVVTPADGDKVLMRWKTGENEYRVIYGNLTAETVTTQKLAELESKLPK